MSQQNAEVLVEHVTKKVGSPHGAMTQALMEVGVDMSTIARTLKDGLEATTFVKMGALAPPLEVADHSVRHRFMESALDIMGGRAPTKQVVESIKTHEETVAVVEGIRSNPELLMALQRRIQSRTVQQITTEVVADEG